MAIALDQYQLVYKPVPKAACSSVKAGLALLDETVAVSMEDLAGNNKEIHRIYPTDRFRRRRWMRYRDHFRFTVVRDPIKRLLSVYTNRVVAKNELYHSRKLRKVQDRLPTHPDPDFFFQNLVAYMDHSSSIKHHALHSHHFTGRDLSLYSKVYRTSDLAELGADLSEIVGREVTIPRFNSTDSPLKFEDLAPKTRLQLLYYLAPEYEHLGALFPRPL